MENRDYICSVSELIGLFRKQTNIEGFLQEVVNLVSEHIECDACSIFLRDQDSDDLILRATNGLNPDLIGIARLAEGQGVTGLSLKQLRPISVPRASLSPHNVNIEGSGDDEYESLLAVPIIHGLNRIGAFVIQHKEVNRFTSKDKRAIRSIAYQLAAILENAKLILEIHKKKVSKKLKSQENLIYTAKVASEGIAFGTIFLFDREKLIETDKHKYGESLDDFSIALEKTKTQIESLQRDMEDRLSDVGSLIFSSHLLMLKDESFYGSMIERIKSGTSPAQAINQVINEYTKLFSENSNPNIKEKVQDLRDLQHRLLKNLSQEGFIEGDYENQIVVAKELLPSELVKLAAQKAEGFILHGNTLTSHIAILSRSIEVPVLFIDDEHFFHAIDDEAIIMDAFDGKIIVRPEEDTRKHYLERKAIKTKTGTEAIVHDKTYTLDGQIVQIMATVNLLADITIANKWKAEGVGLYRSEFPFLIRNDFPSEEEQYKLYRRVIKEMHGKPVTLRTLDIGGDKILSYIPQMKESNPFLGLRAIRFALKNQDIFKQQLRAMLRAGFNENLQIMFPLVSDLSDFLNAKKVIDICINELEDEGTEHNPKPKLGAMIELASAVTLIDDITEVCDFISIGSNDLVQYLLGVDRTNEDVANYYISHHPAVLKSLNIIAVSAKKNACSLTLCGDIAADKLMLPFLIGIGIHCLSVNPKLISRTQKAIENISYDDAKIITRHVLSLKDSKEIEHYLLSLMEKN